MRIIAGTARGRTLKMPKGSHVRPTADRVKETVFNVLGQWLDGERVLDLYAGAGSLGLEALSRGAEHATFVDKDARSMAALTENIHALGFADATTSLLKPVERAIGWLGGQGESFSLVFSDPPYASQGGLAVLTSLVDSVVLKPNARVVIEHDKREALPEQIGSLVRIDERKFGDTSVTFFAVREQVAE